MPHLVQMQKEFGGKGLVLINISLDNDKEKCRKFVKEKGMNWFQVCDGKGWNAGLYVGHGWNSIPRKFLLDPNGKVVCDYSSMGDEEKMRAKIKEVFKATPPTRKGNPAVSDGSDELAAANKLFESQQYAKALKEYEKIAKANKDSEAGKKAAAKVKEIKADKTIYGAIVKAEADKQAPKLMKMAADMADAGKPEQARKYYKQIVDKYPGTEHAEKAQAELDKLQ